MTNVIRYNILKDGDRTLKGKLGEMLFEKISEGCFPNGLICRTGQMQSLFRCCGRLNFYNEKLDLRFGMLEEVIIEMQHGRPVLMEELATVKEKFANTRRKIKELAGQFGLNCAEVYERPRCFFCGQDQPTWVQWPQEPYLVRPNNNYVPILYFVCRQCNSRIQSSNGAVELGQSLADLEMIQGVWLDLKSLIESPAYGKCMKILSAMSEQNIEFYPFADWRWLEFLKKLYDNSLGQTTFDYMGIDSNGNKLLIEVKSTCGSNGITLTQKEREYAEKAKANGFIVVVPFMQYADNWDVLIELRSI